MQAAKRARAGSEVLRQVADAGGSVPGVVNVAGFLAEREGRHEQRSGRPERVEQRADDLFGMRAMPSDL